MPAGVLRDRPADVLQPEALARLHRGYHNRVVFGPGWRADLWTVLEREPELSTAAAARRVGCGFATAWQVARDFRVVHAGVAGEGSGGLLGRVRCAPRRHTPIQLPNNKRM